MVIWTAVLTASCSFHSSQLNTLGSVFSEEEVLLEEVAWTAMWNGNEYKLYAVSAPNETIFAYDRKIYVHFDGWNITKTSGILPYDGDVIVRHENDVLAYYLNERLLARHECSTWGEVAGAVQRYHQECEGREFYSNQIDLDSVGTITRLEFRIHPEYPPIVLTPLHNK